MTSGPDDGAAKHHNLKSAPAATGLGGLFA